MVLPDPLEYLFQWIETNGLFVDTEDRRIGFLFPEQEQKKGWTDAGRPGGTDIEFSADHDPGLQHWFGKEDPDIARRLCPFARTGGDGSSAAFWLADDGSQKIVHMGSGSGSTTVCILADDAIDFLRLLAIGYQEICWGEFFEAPPSASGFIVEPNHAYVDWVMRTFDVTIPQRGNEIVKNHAHLEDKESDDAFWRWVHRHVGW